MKIISKNIDNMPSENERPDSPNMLDIRSMSPMKNANMKMRYFAGLLRYFNNSMAGIIWTMGYIMIDNVAIGNWQIKE